MEFFSILNDVLGPVMRGPSSSHTAGSYRIGSLVRSLLGEEPSHVEFTFDPEGSMAPTYAALGVDIASVAGVMGWSMMDDDYPSAIDRAAKLGVRFDFTMGHLRHSDHPNAVWIRAETNGGKTLLAGAESIGGGAIRFTRVDRWSVLLTGESHDVLVEVTGQGVGEVERLLTDTMLLGGMKRLGPCFSTLGAFPRSIPS